MLGRVDEGGIKMLQHRFEYLTSYDFILLREVSFLQHDWKSSLLGFIIYGYSEAFLWVPAFYFL